MSANGYLQLALYFVVLLALAKPLGAYMARIYGAAPSWKGRAGYSTASPAWTRSAR